MTINVNDSNFEEIVLKSELPVLVDFGAEWCGPCRAIAPYVEQIAAEYEGKAVVCKADVSECPDVTVKYEIRNIPAILYFKGGEAVNKQVGLAPKAALVKMLEELF